MEGLPAEVKDNDRDGMLRSAVRHDGARPPGGHCSAEKFGQGRLTAHVVRFIVLKEEEKNNLAVFASFRKRRPGE
ncbi:hypothetical protein, partial [uncultured Mailhella sp.]|uniref:hypothetical protein n=1 Tax=uncultured Mailhella sp. TaxID=1981031 RepID=UPI0025FF250E